LTTEGGALLLGEANRKVSLLRRVADCFTKRKTVEHGVNFNGVKFAV
jgi:hypothetical protein